jgi:pyrrolidone-carboxylate peptidase
MGNVCGLDAVARRWRKPAPPPYTVVEFFVNRSVHRGKPAQVTLSSCEFASNHIVFQLMLKPQKHCYSGLLWLPWFRDHVRHDKRI